MPDAEYEWWIDQKVRDPSGTLHVTRLLHYGPFRDEKAAERQIGELKRTNGIGKSHSCHQDNVSGMRNDRVWQPYFTQEARAFGSFFASDNHHRQTVENTH